MTRSLTLAEYVALERPQLCWVVDHLIPKPGLVVLLGEPFVGKSFMALKLALDVANGRPFAGRQCSPGPVLYFQFDPSEFVWRERLIDLNRAGVSIGGPVYMPHPDDNRRNMHILLPTHQDFIREQLLNVDPVLVIIDVIREIHSLDENSSTDMKIVGDIMMDIFHGRAIVALHHITKPKPGEPEARLINQARGSSYLAGKADALWLLTKTTLTIESRFEKGMTKVCRQTDSGTWVI